MSKKALKLTIEEKEGCLIIRAPVDHTGTPSRSGKTKVLASTRGNRLVDLKNGRTVYVSVNVYEYLE